MRNKKKIWGIKRKHTDNEENLCLSFYISLKIGGELNENTRK